MADTKIEWTDKTWNPWWGCEKIAPECDHCYAATLASRGLHQAHRGVALAHDWTGKITRSFDSVWQSPLTWPPGAKVFTCSMSDFWHEDVPLTWLDEALDIIDRTPHLIYQVLTKRPANVGRKLDHLKRRLPANVWIGATAGHPDSLPVLKPLRRIEATLKFLSVEPLLAPMVPGIDLDGIGWVICGGENELGGRPCKLKWVRAVRDLCAEEEVPFFFKQWGRWDNNALYLAAEKTNTHTGRVRWAIRHGEKAATIFEDAKSGKAKIVGAKGGATVDGKLWRQFPALSRASVEHLRHSSERRPEA
jgi:protein gp37